MKTQVEKISELGRKMNVEVPATIVKSTFQKIFSGLQKEANLKGFRKGKAPLDTIRQLYGDRVKKDVVEQLLQLGYSKGLQEHALEPVSYPNFEFDEVADGSVFTFSVDFEIRPEVELKKVEKIDVKKEKLNVSDDRIDKIVENIRGQKAQMTPVLEDRAAALGDFAVVDFFGTISGTPLEGGKGQDHNLELGSKSFIDGFEEGIVGMKVGSEKILNLSFPTPYHSEKLAGQAVDFKVTLKALKKRDLPEMNDEWVLSLGGEEKTLVDLKARIRKDVTTSEEVRIQDELKNRVLKRLTELNPMEVPNSLLEDQKKMLIQDFQKRMTQEGMSEEEFKAYVEKFDRDFAATAKSMIQAGYIIDAIAKSLDLYCKKEDVEAKMEQYQKQSGITMERIREIYGKAENMNRLSYQITEEKVVAQVLKSAIIVELPAEQLKESTN